VGAYVEAAGVGKKGACHLFRHTLATVMLENGADIRYIQQMLGHAELSSTEVYTQVSIQKLKEVHRATHPTARLRPRKTADGSPETGEN
jgi:integrase/recombinase XerD